MSREPDGWVIERDGVTRLFGRLGHVEYCDVRGEEDVLERLRYLPGARMFALYRHPHTAPASTIPRTTDGRIDMAEILRRDAASAPEERKHRARCITNMGAKVCTCAPEEASER